MQIYSEIGQLKKVLLHKPGKELEHLIPKELERLLFDDIPYLKTAREEHDAFADTLRSQGVEVVYLCDLMAETLRAEPELKEQFIRQLILEGGSKPRNFENELTAYLMSIREEKALVYKTMAGVSAAELGVSRSYLSSCFKKSVGCSPQAFILNLRMERAGTLLRTTTLPVNVISGAVGYQDQLAFSKIFKQFYGVSPRDFRKGGFEVVRFTKKGDFENTML